MCMGHFYIKPIIFPQLVFLNIFKAFKKLLSCLAGVALLVERHPVP